MKARCVIAETRNAYKFVRDSGKNVRRINTCRTTHSKRPSNKAKKCERPSHFCSSKELKAESSALTLETRDKCERSSHCELSITLILHFSSIISGACFTPQLDLLLCITTGCRGDRAESTKGQPATRRVSSGEKPVGIIIALDKYARFSMWLCRVQFSAAEMR